MAFISDRDFWIASVVHSAGNSQTYFQVKVGLIIAAIRRDFTSNSGAIGVGPTFLSTTLDSALHSCRISNIKRRGQRT